MQLEMFAPTRARRTDPLTSHMAAERSESLASAHFAIIRAALRKHGPSTIYDLAEVSGLTHVQIARRLPEMDDAMPTDETAPSPSGRACRTWKLA